MEILSNWIRFSSVLQLNKLKSGWSAAAAPHTEATYSKTLNKGEVGLMGKLLFFLTRDTTVTLSPAGGALHWVFACSMQVHNQGPNTVTNSPSTYWKFNIKENRSSC